MIFGNYLFPLHCNNVTQLFDKVLRTLMTCNFFYMFVLKKYVLLKYHFLMLKTS